MPQHLIFEGAELSGKSWIMSQIYLYLEKKYGKSKNILDGCLWFNCDNGIFGFKESQKIIENYLNIFTILKNKNIIVEKFYISDQVYQKFYRNKNIFYKKEDKILKKLGFKIICLTFPKNKELIKNRLKDRLKLYPHYKKIAKKIEWYINQQEEIIKNIKKSCLPSIILEIKEFPNQRIIKQILNWINEE